MLIVCPSCASEYALDPARIGPAGRSVRCARCRESWFVNPAPTEASGAAPDPGPPTLAGEAVSARSGPDGPPLAASRRRRASREPSALRRRAARFVRPLAAGLAALALLGGGAALVLGRAGVVRALPSTARLYERAGLAVNLRGLEFRGVDALLAAAEPAALMVEGEIANVAGRPVPVPPVEIVVRGEGAPALYTWTALPDQDTLGPGEATRFRARLVEPPSEGREVAVRFAAPARAALAQRAP